MSSSANRTNGRSRLVRGFCLAAGLLAFAGALSGCGPEKQTLAPPAPPGAPPGGGDPNEYMKQQERIKAQQGGGGGGGAPTAVPASAGKPPAK